MIKGAKLENHKEMSITNEIVDMTDVKTVYIPLVNHSNLHCKCLVKVGKKVSKDTIIGIREEMNFPIYSSVSGKVVDISKCLYLNGELVDCVVIESDGKNTESNKTIVDDITNYSKEGYIEIIRKCAVSGIGGSDFPTYLKYKDKLDTLIVNAVECEPYITSDYMISRLKSKEILEVIDAIMKINDIKTGIIAYKKYNTAIYESFSKYISNYPNIKLIGVKNMYPMGWERHVVKSAVGVEYDRFPSEKGIVVNNVSTIYSIYYALKYQEPISERILTLSGCNFKEKINVMVKIGTNLKDIIEKLGGYNKISSTKFIAGGPMMGKSLLSDELVVTKNLNCVIAIKDYTDNEESPCIRCGRCDYICPANLSPVLIKDNIKNIDELKKLRPLACMECGLCSYICPSKINLRNYVMLAKSEVKK
mgnify:CR=1 FL=1